MRQNWVSAMKLRIGEIFECDRIRNSGNFIKSLRLRLMKRAAL